MTHQNNTIHKPHNSESLPYQAGIEIYNVTKRFRVKDGYHTVLKNLNFTLPKDKNIGILGRNGAGKTTLLKIIFGQEFAEEGYVDLKNIRISWPIGGACLKASLTAIDNVKFVSRIYDIDIMYAIDFVSHFTELGKFLYMPVNTYSAGMKTRLAFALSAMIDFDCYLVDEGFNAADAQLGKRMEERFMSKNKKANMVVVSHNPRIIQRFCECVAVMKEGKLEYYADINEGIKAYQSL